MQNQQSPQTGARSPLPYGELPQPITAQSQEPQPNPVSRQQPPRLNVEEFIPEENAPPNVRHVKFSPQGSPDSESMSENDDTPTRSTESHRINLDLKHHPSKRAKPDRRYCHAFDVYSLGIALLEIGLSDTIEEILDDVKTDKDPFETRRQRIEMTESDLPHSCGEIYTKAVVACLSIETVESEIGLSEIGLAEQRELCMRIATDLAPYQA